MKNNTLTVSGNCKDIRLILIAIKKKYGHLTVENLINGKGLK